MRLKSKVLAAVAAVFIGHFVLVEYLSHQQIKSEVITDIRNDARIVRAMVMAFRATYQKYIIAHNVPINDMTLGLLPSESMGRISQEFRNWIDSGLTFNNVSDVPRNPGNMADKIEMEAINYFRNKPDAQERMVPFSDEKGEPYYHYSQPIWMEQNCLKCHGDYATAPESVRKRYHLGYGYKLGDFGGLMSIKLPASVIEQRVSKQFFANAISHFSGFLATFFILSWLLQCAVVSRIDKLKDAAVRMSNGDYSGQARLPGSDEVTQVSNAFDDMAQKMEERERALEAQRSLYAALFWTSKSITRLDSQQELFADTCRIAVAYGGMAQAYIGMLDAVGDNLIVLAGAEGDVGELVFPLFGNAQDDIAPIAIAVRDNRSIITNDAMEEYPTSQWQNMLLQSTMQSAAMFPLRDAGKAIGVFCVFSGDRDFFREDMIELLDEMAAELSYAIHNYNLAQEHRQAHQQLKDSSLEMRHLNTQLRLLLESTGEGIFGVDLNGDCTFINQSALEMLGFVYEDIIGKSPHDLTHHSYADGSPFPGELCPVHEAFRTGSPCRVQKDVFWRKDGTSFPVEYSAYPIIEDSDVLGAVTVFRDVTDSHAMEQRLSFLATHDPLTRLLNRYAFEQSLKQALQDAHANLSQHALCYMDLDQFKLVNDTCGHVAGDAMLQMIAKLLQNSLRKNDTLARLGGDEFGLLLENCSLERAEKLASKICEGMKEFRFSWDDKTFTTGVSVGIAEITEESTSIDLVMSAADAACYVAKDMGRNRVHIHMADDEETARRQGEMRWVTEIQSAIEDSRLYLSRQLILPLCEQEREMEHFEILLRMRDKGGKDVPPGAFIPAAERFALMPMLDRWVVQHTLSWLREAQQKGLRLGLCSINISGHSLADVGLMDFIVSQLNSYNITAEKICFEITETAAVSRLDQAIHFIGGMREMGCRFALDDFGTGMSSFAYLKNLPVDFLKIDGGFVRDLLDDPVDCGMVESINQIGHLMGLQTIAEYVENDRVRERLAEIGVDYVQGFGVAAPEPLE